MAITPRAPAVDCRVGSYNRPVSDTARRRADIQGLRGVAVLLVVLYHAGLRVPGGFTGVDVFFVISGFVITGLLLRELEATGSLELRRFYARRIRRLLPALALMLVVVAVVGVLASPLDGQVTGSHTGIAASLFAANIYLLRLSTGYFDAKTTLDPLLHTWTLGVEEQFYLVFPALLLISWRLSKRRSRGISFLTIACVSAASLGLALALSIQKTSPAAGRFAFYGSPVRAWEFGIGALLAIGSPRIATVDRGTLSLVAIAGLAAVVAAAFLIHGTSAFAGWRMLLPVAGAVGILAGGLSGLNPVSRCLSAQPLVWIGDLSYSWYLWHWPVIVFAKALFPTAPVSAAAALVSLAPAWLSYRYVENPIRFHPRMRGSATVALAAVCIAIPIGACVGLIEANHLLVRSTALKRWQAVTQTYISGIRGCESLTPLGQRRGVRWSNCTSTVAHARGRIVLLGDSNGSQFSEPVLRAGVKAGFDVTLAPLYGCPFTALKVAGTSVSSSDCNRFDLQSLTELLRRPPAFVVVANREDRYIADPTTGFVRADGKLAVRSARQGAALGTEPCADRRTSQPRRRIHCDRPAGAFDAGCAERMCGDPRAHHSLRELYFARGGERIARRADRAEHRAAAGNPAAKVMSLENSLCGPTRCSTVRNGTVIYRDRDHLDCRRRANVDREVLPRLCFDRVDSSETSQRSPMSGTTRCVSDPEQNATQPVPSSTR